MSQYVESELSRSDKATVLSTSSSSGTSEATTGWPEVDELFGGDVFELMAAEVESETAI